jgi:hypothetical protein
VKFSNTNEKMEIGGVEIVDLLDVESTIPNQQSTFNPECPISNFQFSRSTEDG